MNADQNDEQETPQFYFYKNIHTGSCEKTTSFGPSESFSFKWKYPCNSIYVQENRKKQRIISYTRNSNLYEISFNINLYEISFNIKHAFFIESYLSLSA